jgi:hypothetical protein
MASGIRPVPPKYTPAAIDATAHKRMKTISGSDGRDVTSAFYRCEPIWSARSATLSAYVCAQL